MRKFIRLKASILLIVFLVEIFAPYKLFALTSGPSQPEMASFTPAGVTDMVDPFTGDFSYNIPLLDVEGYPINIAYNSGITMEQEASWVGLGWNINVGTINRSVRGLPDDFKGDVIKTKTNLKKMEITKFGGGLGLEVFGKELKGQIIKKYGANMNLNLSFIFNNYKGFGISYGGGLGVSLKNDGFKASQTSGFEINTLDGFSKNSSLGASFSYNKGKENSFFFGGSIGTGFNSRTGQTIRTFGTTAGYSKTGTYKKNDKYRNGYGASSLSASATFLPIGLETYTPYPTLKMQSNSVSFSASVGGEVFGVNGNVNVYGSKTTQELIDNSTTTKSYGYFYSEEAEESALLDFNRDREVELNKTTPNLSPTNFTYDVYSVSGQGVSGTFRPFRNDIGVVHDPVYNRESEDSKSSGVEVGLGAYYHGGLNVNIITNKSIYGPWYGNIHDNFKFRHEEINSPFEKVYFKAAGELTESNEDYFQNELGGIEALAVAIEKLDTEDGMIDKSGGLHSIFNLKQNNNRVARAKVFSYLTAKEALALDPYKEIHSYKGEFFNNKLVKESINREDNNKKPHHLSVITQTNPNGERYVFGIPAYNNIKNEVTYNTDENSIDSLGRIQVKPNEASLENDVGIDHYYSELETPAYAHSYLLTEKQSVDYQDVTGDGVSPDDIGNAWKFNYTRTSENYHWRMPYKGSNLMKGYESIDDDQKASYATGDKEIWYLHSIESKNQIAEFIISEREDGIEASRDINGGLPTVNGDEERLYQLDTIKLFNKYDRVDNKKNATPIQTVVFTYDSSLCMGVENRIGLGGKLTLKKIEIYFGESEKGKLSPYIFEYNDGLNGNPFYNPIEVDRWGNYKNSSKNPGNLSNEDFPYVLQNEDSVDKWAAAWHMTKIIKPSGGIINIDYESDDYAYVQDKVAMQMFSVIGAGDSEAYTSNNTLYGNNYLFIENDFGVSASEDLKQIFFGDGYDLMENLYFKFRLNIDDKTPKEFVSGYVKAVDIGIATNDSTKIWIKLEQTPYNYPSPISKVAWNFFRQNLFDKLYNQPKYNDGKLEAVLRELLANINDIKQMLINDGVEKHLGSKSVAKYFKIGESFIRLNNPIKRKKGGGVRVVRIELNDNWASMADDGSNATYGQTYEYTTEEDGKIISSGVASYEPFIGNDENPFRKPSKYISQASQGHIPAIEAYQEEPLGETFFPSPVVGYSNVKVKNIHADIGRTSNLITEYSFHTAKDYPYIINKTSLNGKQKYDAPATSPRLTFPFVSQTNHSKFAASQGYALILNDMHGKPKTIESYTLQEDPLNNNRIYKKIVSGERYTYHDELMSNGQKRLNNKVEVLSSDGSIKENLLGVEYDVVIDSRSSYESSKSRSNKGNVDLIPSFFGISFPIPTYYNNTIIDIQEVKTMVVTKVIQMYGIVKSVENYTDQYATTIYNELYDGTTGEALLTRTEDEHNADEYQFSVPAYITPQLQRMGPAFYNSMYTAIIDSAKDLNCKEQIGSYHNPGFLRHGDEVLITTKDDSSFKAWVDLDFQTTNPINNRVENNGKDPLISLDENKTCKSSYWEYLICGEYYGTYRSIPCAEPIVINSDYILYQMDFSAFKNEVELFLPKAEIVDFFLDPPFDSTHLNNKAFCNEFKAIGKYLFIVDNYLLDGFMLNCGNNPYNILDLFDMNESYIANLNSTGIDSVTSYSYCLGLQMEDAVVNSSQKLKSLLLNPNKHGPLHNITKGGGLSSFFLAKTKYFDINNGKTEDVYFVLGYGKDDVIKAREIQFAGIEEVNDYFVKNPTIVNTLLNDFEPPLCGNTFKILNEIGEHVGGLEGSIIKVIRSGNRNMLTSYEGSIVSNGNPIIKEGGKFKRLKSHKEINITQASAMNYIEEGEIRPSFINPLTLNTNKFLRGEEGSFKIGKTYRYIASRYQNDNEVETPVDGYFESLPKLWNAIDECYFMLNSPIQYERDPEWVVDETITFFDERGNSIEAKNALNIYSSVLIDVRNMVKATANNAKQKSIAVEDFESYGQTFAGRVMASQTNIALLDELLTSTPSYSLSNVSYFEPSYLGSISPIVLVKGVAHTGEYSIFLKGENPSGGNINLSYTEKSAVPLSQYNLVGGIPNLNKQYSTSNSAYENHKQDYEENFKGGLRDPSDFESALLNGTNKLTVKIDTNGNNTNYHNGNYGWEPEEGKKYYFSAWVKDISPSHLPYHGASPRIYIEVDSGTFISTLKEFKMNSGIIDGWFQISGEFTYPSSSDNVYLVLDGGLWGTFFDDIRIAPIKSSMETYVYDRKTNRLAAKLDENNYATFFEYNSEGIPSQVKKETEKGVLTISESRQEKFKNTNNK